MKRGFRQRTTFLLTVLILIFTSVPSAWATGNTLDPFEGLSGANMNGLDTKAPNNFFIQNGVFSGTANGTYMSWDNVNFTDNPVSVDISYGSPNKNIGLEIHLDNVGGTLLASFADTSTGSWAVTASQTAEITQKISGVHTVYLLWTGGGCNVKDIKFYRKREVNLGYTPLQSVLEKREYEDITDFEFAKKVSVLKQLGFLSFATDKNFEADKKLSLGEYAEGLSYFYTDEIPESDVILYRDILKNYPKYNAVNFAASNGIVKDKNNDGLLEPYEGVKADELLEFIIDLLGYKDEAERMGDSFMYARKLGLLKGVEVVSGMELTRRIFTEVIYNALELDYKEFNIVGEEYFAFEKRQGILYKTRNMNKGSGIVEATPSTSLADPGSTAGNNNIIINGEIFSVKSEKEFMYLGYECEYYYNRETYELMGIYPKKDVEETVIGYYTDTELEYIDNSQLKYSDKNKIRTIEFDKNTYFVYNGKAADDKIRNFVTENTFSGNIRVIENKNSKAVIIDDYTNVRIKTFDSIGKAFTDGLSGKVFSFDSDNVEYAIYKNGVMIDSELITSGDCAIVYESKNKTGQKIVRIVIDGFEKINGVVSSVYEDEIMVNDIPYTKANELSREITAGLMGVFYINPYGEIVYYEDALSDEWSTVIFCNAYYDEDEADFVRMRIYDEVLGYVIEDCAKMLIVDGVMRKEPEQAMNGFGLYKGFNDIEKRTPALIKRDENMQITAIDTIEEGSKNGGDRLTKIASSSSFGYRAGLKCLVDKTTGASAQPMASDAKLLSYYSGYDDNYNTIEDFKAQMSYQTMADGVAYAIGEKKTADIFFWKNRPMSEENENFVKFFVYENSGVGLNEDDEPVMFAEGYTSGAKVKYPISNRCSEAEKTLLNTQIQSLSKGDLMSIETDAFGGLLTIEVYCYADGSKTKGAGEAKFYYAGTENGETYDNSVRYNKDLSATRIFGYGTITDYENEFFEITFPDGLVEYVYPGNASLMRVAVDNKTVIKASANPQSVIAANPEGGRIFYYIQDGNVREAVVFDRKCFE